MIYLLIIKLKTMKKKLHKGLFLFLTLAFSTASCVNNKITNDYLVSFTDENTEQSGYQNSEGTVIIPAGKYEMCITDTFRTFAIVLNKDKFIAIDREEKEMYEVYNYDNGPDYESEGLYRIVKNKKVGFADAITGEIRISPKYMCAFPFEDGVAKVTEKCTMVQDGEHSTCESDSWLFIDKSGKIISKGKM